MPGKHGDVTQDIEVCLKMLCKPLNPMVLLIIIPMKNGYFIGNIPNIFRQTHIEVHLKPTYILK